MKITSDAEPVAGQDYVLTCTASLQGEESDTENLDATKDTLWTLPNNSVVETTTDQLQLNPLRVSDGGIFTCRVSITSPYLSSTIFSSGSYSVTVESKCNIAFLL